MQNGLGAKEVFLKNLEYWIWFSRLKINKGTKRKIIEKYINPKRVFDLKENELKKIFKNVEIINEVLNQNNRNDLDIANKYIIKNNIKIIDYYSEKYPILLKEIYDPPILLYCVGNESLLNRKSIAIVGTRSCSAYGEYIARKVSFKLSNRYVIVSGMATRNR